MERDLARYLSALHSLVPEAAQRAEFPHFAAHMSASTLKIAPPFFLSTSVKRKREV